MSTTALGEQTGEHVAKVIPIRDGITLEPPGNHAGPAHWRELVMRFRVWLAGLLDPTRRPAAVGKLDDSGMSTAEYAIGTVAAAAFAAALYMIVTSDSVVHALTSLVQRALSMSL